MRRSFFGSMLYLLAPDSAAGLSTVTGDAALDTAVMGKLGLDMEQPEGTSNAQHRTPNAEGEDKSKAQSPKAKAEEGAKAEATEEEETAEQKAEREAAEAREVKINELVDAGKTREEAEAEVDAATTTDDDEDDQNVQAPELTEEVKTWHEGQIAAKDEEISTLTTRATEAEAKVTELTQALEAAGTQPLAIAPIDPLFLIDDPAKLEAKAGELRQFEAWLLANWDGVEAVEASADGKTKAQPGFTKEQIRERYAQVKQAREELVPAAREGIKARQAHEAQARKVYPELFDPKRPEHKAAEGLLRLAPGLRAIVPNIHIVIGDALRGEKVRVAEEKARAAKGKGIKPGVKPAAPKQIAKPSGGAGAVRQPAVTTAAKKQVINTDKFTKAMESGVNGRAALVEALSQ